MRFSIIVPVYNVQDYLKKCLDSIVNQDYDDYEIVLVNDGSTDGSAKICEQYAEIYKCIKYYVKNNGGLSDARNFGIEHARGQYCVFIDSDDWIAQGCLRKIDATIGASQTDLVVTRLIEVYPDQIRDKDTRFIVVIFACIYPTLINHDFDFLFSFSLIIIISLSTFAQGRLYNWRF